MPPSILTLWAPQLKVYSGYGPTEAAICVTAITVSPEMNPRNIGRPLKHVTIMILDPSTLKLVSSGEIGELCIIGPQLARGYLKRPEATAKVFQTQPDGTVLYQTGDLARWLPTGEIELFGRKDDQIKLNGHRIELGEVESIIMEAKIFSQCVVIAATVLKKKQLVAFCLISGSDDNGTNLLLPPSQVPKSSAIKQQLGTLSRYMIPNIWLPVSKFPLMPSGKTDRKNLLALVEGMDDDALREYLPIEEILMINSEAESVLQSSWCALFDVSIETIHANSSFHALGGDSISAISLVSMLRRQGYEIGVNDVLSNPTLKEQAALLTKISSHEDEEFGISKAKSLNYQPSEAVYEQLARLEVSRGEIEDIYPCAPGQIEFLTQGNKQEHFWQLMAVRKLPDDLDFDHWVYLTTKLTAHNSILRTLYLYLEKDNPQTAIQVVMKLSSLNLRYRFYTSNEGRRGLLDAEWAEPFDPSKPAVRYTLLVNSQSGKRELVIKLDHASYDGSLLHIFDEQFQALAQNHPLPQHTAFKDFINYAVSVPKEPQLRYWTSLLQNHPFTFPTALSDPLLSSGVVARISSSLCVDSLAESCRVTAPIVFQTAYTLLLAHLSGSNDVVYDNLITGRNVPLDNPQLINGNCANFLPFHTALAESTSTAELLQATQASFWAATDNGFVSLGEIYDALGQQGSNATRAKCLFCFQPFQPAPDESAQDHMRWIVMKMSENRMAFNYVVQLEVRKGKSKGEYVVRFEYDERAFTKEDAGKALDWYVKCLDGMVKAPEGLVSELEV